MVANYELNNKIIANRGENISQGIEYTPKMLLTLGEAKNGISSVVLELFDSYYIEKELIII